MKEADINTHIGNFQDGILSSNENIYSENAQGLPNIQQPLIRPTKYTVEIEKSVNNGYCMLFIIIFSALVDLGLIPLAIIGGIEDFWPVFPVFFLLLIVLIIISKGFFTNKPNVGHVITYFGKYLGSVKKVGFFWINPFYSHSLINLKRNIFRSEVIKVNDKVGNPIMVGCIVVWRVKDTAKAFFDVQNYANYVRVQTETAIRYIGCKYPYEKINSGDICLRSGHTEINNELKRELIERLEASGIDIVETYINEMSYAPEIASVMLKRQSAQAIIAAREKIVQGAVSIAGHAANSLKVNNIVELNEEEKSDVVSNLILVLCTESNVSPVVNAGTGALFK